MSSENERDASTRKRKVLILVFVFALVLMLASRPFSRWNKHTCACVPSENQALQRKFSVRK